MKRSKIIKIISTMFALGIFFLLCRYSSFFNSLYLFNWISHNWSYYLILCLFPVFYLVFDKEYTSLFVSGAIILGSTFGQLVGDWIRRFNFLKLYPGMPAQERAQLMIHRGFAIWMVVLVIATIVGLLIDRRKSV